MNKIICDVCGTDYPETAEQCPICGCANAGEQATADAVNGQEGAPRSYVKGGRFSKKNVNKRLKEMGVQQSYAEPVSIPEPEYEDDHQDEDQEPDDEEPQGSNLGLVIIVIILLLAIAAVSAYIGITFFGLGGGKSPILNNNNPTTSTTAPTEEVTEPTNVACTDLALSDVDIYLDTQGATWSLTAEIAPENTTDILSFTSTDESVVKVDPVTGLVTAVGNGEASIIATCGDVVRECPVKCEFEEVTEAPTEPEEAPKTYSLMVNGSISPYGDAENAEVTIAVGDSFRLTVEDEQGLRQDVTWKASKDGICSVSGRTVTGEASGKVTLTAKLGDQTFKCIIIVK